MPTIINPDDLAFKNDPTALEAFDLLTLTPRLTKVTGSTHFVFDLRELDPGKYSFPYHFHHNAEELIMIVSGTMTIRTPAGFETAGKGQLVFFETGQSGAHQFHNHTDIPCVYLDIRSTPGLDVSEYPDSGKINILPTGAIFEKESQVEYNKGEENVQAIWDRLKNSAVSK